MFQNVIELAGKIFEFVEEMRGFEAVERGLLGNERFLVVHIEETDRVVVYALRSDEKEANA